ncbi:hypothetical protein HBB16_11915 [Pseudonocardia sp. MCCB 268]|nr:hypothetical protein [Pseudonocardia cytotoxica]
MRGVGTSPGPVMDGGRGPGGGTPSGQDRCSGDDPVRAAPPPRPAAGDAPGGPRARPLRAQAHELRRAGRGVLAAVAAAARRGVDARAVVGRRAGARTGVAERDRRAAPAEQARRARAADAGRVVLEESSRGRSDREAQGTLDAALQRLANAVAPGSPAASEFRAALTTSSEEQAEISSVTSPRSRPSSAHGRRGGVSQYTPSTACPRW